MQKSLEVNPATKVPRARSYGLLIGLAFLSFLGWIISLKFPAFRPVAIGSSGLFLLGCIVTPMKYKMFRGVEEFVSIREISQVRALRGSDRILLVALFCVGTLALLTGNWLVWQAAQLSLNLN